MQVDGLLRVNGDFENNGGSIGSENKERDSPPHFQASPDAPQSDASAARSPPASPERESAVSAKASDRVGNTEAASQDVQAKRVTEVSPPPTRPTSLPEVRFRMFRILHSDTI